MAGKKKGAKKNTSKKEKKASAKPKKAARQAAPKASKRKQRSATPTSGQSGPTLDLMKDKLNDKETSVVGVLQGDVNPMPINALATNCFSSQESKLANSWVRNSLRRLVRAKWVEKVGKGTYRLTDMGRERASGAAAATPAPAPAPAQEQPAEAAQPTA